MPHTFSVDVVQFWCSKGLVGGFHLVVCISCPNGGNTYFLDQPSGRGYRQSSRSIFRKAKWLSAKARRDNVWQDVVSEIRQDHPRKYGFITELEKVVAGMPCESSETLEERAKKRWKRLTSR